jgi:precorrin-4 methylase
MLHATEIYIKTSPLSYRKVVRGMNNINKTEVVELMTAYIENMNREMAISHGMDSTQIEIVLNQAKPDLQRVNGQLFDLLVERGVIIL